MTNVFTRRSMPGGTSGRFLLCSLLALLATIAATGSLLVPVQHASAQGKILAPDLVGGTGWLGTDRPLQLKDLRGKIVILEFWTLC
jgi:hypothetical protein